MEFVPQVLRDADARLQRLSSQSPQDVEGFEGIIGESRTLRLAVGFARRAARRDVSVLLEESGTGKEKFARAIHDASPRKKNRFVSINCAAISRELLESELFGHKKGSFTGAGQIVMEHSKKLTAVRSSWMKLANVIHQCRPNCCESCNLPMTILVTEFFVGLVTLKKSPAMSESSPPQTGI